MNKNSVRRFAPLALLACAVAPALAGPPFQTDDPEPIDYKHFEFYTFGSADGTKVLTGTVTPGFELNYGAAPNLHLHLIVPFGSVIPSNDPKLAPAGIGPTESGLEDIELGVKYRFVQETKTMPMIGTFVMFELPAGNAEKGLGAGKTWYKLPLWAQKSFGKWTTYGGGGATVNTAQGNRTYPFAGWLLQRDIGERLTLAGELFYHGPEGIATAQTRPATLFDFGGYYKIRGEGFQLLFAYGHTVVGQPENYGYLGLYWTWPKKEDGGKDKDKDAKPAGMAFNSMAPHGMGRP